MPIDKAIIWEKRVKETFDAYEVTLYGADETKETVIISIPNTPSVLTHYEIEDEIRKKYGNIKIKRYDN
jgi:hypothetical protein